MIKKKCSIGFPVLAFSFILSLSIVSSAEDSNQITKEEKELDHRDDINIVTFYKNKQKILERVRGKTIIKQKIYYKDSPVARMGCFLSKKMELESVSLTTFPPSEVSVNIWPTDKSVKKYPKIHLDYISIEKRDNPGKIINMFKVESETGILVPLSEKEIEEMTP